MSDHIDLGYLQAVPVPANADTDHAEFFDLYDDQFSSIVVERVPANLVHAMELDISVTKAIFSAIYDRAHSYGVGQGGSMARGAIRTALGL